MKKKSMDLNGCPPTYKHHFFLATFQRFSWFFFIYLLGCTEPLLRHWALPCGVRGLSLVVTHWLSACCMQNLSFSTRDRICVLCIGRQILNPWTSREVPQKFWFVSFWSLIVISLSEEFFEPILFIGSSTFWICRFVGFYLPNLGSYQSFFLQMNFKPHILIYLGHLWLDY